MLFATHLAFTGWRTHSMGDRRDRNAFWLIALYAVMSYYLWWVFAQPYAAFIVMHLVFATVFLLYSTKMVGQILGLSFCAMVVFDTLAVHGVFVGLYPHVKGFLLYSTGMVGRIPGLSFLTTAMSDVNTAHEVFVELYPQVKGFFSHLMMYTIWRGAASDRIFRPVVDDPFTDGRSSGGFIRVASNKKTAATEQD